VDEFITTLTVAGATVLLTATWRLLSRPAPKRREDLLLGTDLMVTALSIQFTYLMVYVYAEPSPDMPKEVLAGHVRTAIWLVVVTGIIALPSMTAMAREFGWRSTSFQEIELAYGIPLPVAPPSVITVHEPTRLNIHASNVFGLLALIAGVAGNVYEPLFK
jgi:hypothetical protein